MKSLFIVLAIALSFAKEPSKSPPTLGIYDCFYSKSDWTWVKDSGFWAMLLKHNTIENCAIAVNMEPWGYENGNWDLKDTIKIIGKTPYRLYRVEIDGDLWCYTFVSMDTSAIEQLNVYMEDSCKTCLKAVEKIIKKKEGLK